MYEWKVEDMALLNEESNIFIGKEKIYKCEQEVSREDKIAFVDSLQDGRLSYILALIEKFDKEKDSLSKDKYGKIRTVSLKAWIKRNDTKYDRNIISDYREYCGRYNLLGISGNITHNYYRNRNGIYNDLICDDFVDEVFHYQLKECEEKEYDYFLKHDEYSILKQKFDNKRYKYNTTFGVHMSIWSSGKLYIKDENRDNEREITIDELKYLLSKYEELDKLVEKITEETNIVY